MNSQSLNLVVILILPSAINNKMRLFISEKKHTYISNSIFFHLFLSQKGCPTSLLVN